MQPILETDRLILREFEENDAEEAYLLNADTEVLRHTGDLPFQSVDDARTFIQQYSDYKKNGFGRWTVILKSSNTFLGWCGLKLHDDGLVDLGYRFRRNQWGKGYATEAAKACVEYGFNSLKIREIIARITPENTSSIRLAERIGMSFWKMGPCGDWENALYYRLAAENLA